MKLSSRFIKNLLKSLPGLLAAAALLCPPFSAPAVPRAAEQRRAGGSSARLVGARHEAAAYIFRYYNRGLSPKKAKEYARYVMEASRRYSIEPSLITAIIVKESTAKENARSKYAVGLMQLYWQLHKKTIRAQFPHIKSERALMEPRNNIMVGTWLFSQYLSECGGNTNHALRRYLGTKSGHYLNRVKQYSSHYSERVSRTMKTAPGRSAARSVSK